MLSFACACMFVIVKNVADLVSATPLYSYLLFDCFEWHLSNVNYTCITLESYGDSGGGGGDNEVVLFVTVNLLMVLLYCS